MSVTLATSERTAEGTGRATRVVHLIAAADDAERRRRAAAAMAVDTSLAVTVSDPERGPSNAAEDAEGRHADAVVLIVPVTDAIEAVRSRRMQEDGTPVIAVVDSGLRKTQLRKVLKAGVEGVVADSAIERALAATVHAACAGQLAVPRQLGQQLAPSALSFREKQVLALITMGFTNGEIAARLFLAESTIKSHLSSAFTKLGAHSRSEAARLILDPDEGLGPGILSLSTGSDAPATG